MYFDKSVANPPLLDFFRICTNLIKSKEASSSINEQRSFIERRNAINVCNSTKKGPLRKDISIYKEHKSMVESRVKVLVHRFKEKLRLL